jgi:hypothetical protein
VIGTVPVPRPAASAGGSDEVGDAEEPEPEGAQPVASTAAIVSHPHRLDVTPRS